MLTSKQRAYLRALANRMETIFQIGKGGISKEICYQIGLALEARELIKVRILENSGYSTREAADELAARTASDVVAVVGTKIVLYRESQTIKENGKTGIALP
jgi:RNA-binding protein